MLKKLLFTAAILLSVPAHATTTTTYKICGLPDAVTVQSTDHFELSRNCGGSYNATGPQLATYFNAYTQSHAPGTTGQLLYNSAGNMLAGSASTIWSLLNLAAVSHTGLYSDLSGRPSLSTVATSGLYSDLSGKPSFATVATSGLYGDLSGKPTSLSQFSNDTGFIASAGAPVQSVNGHTGTAVVSASDLTTGTLPAAQLPNPSPSTLGGVRSLAAVSHSWINTISTSGVPSATQPACGDLSNAGTSCTVNTGSSGATLGLLNSDLTFSGADTFTATPKITKNAASLPAAQTGTLLQVGNADGTASRLESDAFGAGAFFSSIRFDSTAAAPGALLSGEEIGGVNVWGYNGSSVSGPQASFRSYAAQNWTPSHLGTYADIATTANNGTALSEVARFENDGGITVPATVTGGDKGAGTINAGGLFVNGTAAVLTSRTVNGHALSGNVAVTLSDLALMTSATDKTLVRASGTSGGTQSTGITVSNANEISGFVALVAVDSTTARTLAATDCGTTIRFTNASAITLTTLNSLIVGCSVEIVQEGAGQITVANGSGATQENAHSQTKTYGQFARVSLKVVANSGGSSAVFNVAGDTGS